MAVPLVSLVITTALHCSVASAHLTPPWGLASSWSWYHTSKLSCTWKTRHYTSWSWSWSWYHTSKLSCTWNTRHYTSYTAGLTVRSHRHKIYTEIISVNKCWIPGIEQPRLLASSSRTISLRKSNEQGETIGWMTPLSFVWLIEPLSG